MQRLLLVFWSVTVPQVGGAVFTVSVAAVVVAVPAELVNTARYRYPFCDEAVVKPRLFKVAPAPETFLNSAPPSVPTCHCTVGVGEPVAAAVKVAVWHAVSVGFGGWVELAGRRELLQIVKSWFEAPVQGFCSIGAPGAVEAPTTSRHPLVMLPE